MEIQQFWSAISVLIYNFHAINRKIFACLITDVFKIKQNIDQISNSTEINGNDCEQITEFQLKTWLETIGERKEKFNLEDFQGFVIKQKFLLKKFQQNTHAISTIDFTANNYICRFIDYDLDDFCISLGADGNLCFKVLENPKSKDDTERWLEYVLKPKFLNWASNTNKKTPPAIKSLQLIDLEAYNNLYMDLKLKYAECFKEVVLIIWLVADESTDPLKFIYEDLAIASYLICLWRSDKVKKPIVFADLGCGNGLLVNVLNNEGYLGYGYDLRKRKLWSLYSPEVQEKLFETAIVPNKDIFSMPQDVNWLIGNHSDELSAWLPVLATLNSFETCYFLLPCCAFEFSGTKYQRRNAKLSTYQDFFGYAHEISEHCGFQTQRDRLKIPSTKRLALIGFERKYIANDYKQKCLKLKDYIAQEMKRFPHNSGEDVAVKLREKDEPVKNCTKIDQNIITKLVEKIFNLLLNDYNLVALKTEDNIRWHAGGQLSLKDIVAHLSTDELRQLKTECGGIKTLLRNKHEVFEFQKNGLICLRKPQKREGAVPSTKRRECYFHEKHPDGCPLSAEDCSFLHTNMLN